MLNIIRGDTKYYKFQRINKLDESVITAIPDKMYFTVKFDYNVEDVLIQKTLDNEIKFDEETNYYYFVIRPEDTNNLPYGRYVYDIEITEKDKVTTIAIGEINLTEEVTFYSNKESDGVNGEDIFIEDDEVEEITTIEEYAPVFNGGGFSNYNDLSNKPSINDIELIGNKTLDDLNIQKKGDYVSRGTLNELIQELVDGDIANLTELFKELQDVTTKGIYVGYINSVTPNRNNMEEIIKKAINSNASMIILRPTLDLPQDFVAISSGRNLQNYKKGGKGYMFFTDINEHSDSSNMPSVMSYTTKINFTVTATQVGDETEISVVIDDVITDFVSGINSTSQHAYVLHTKNETEYTPTKDYHPATKKYIDDKIVALEARIQQLETAKQSNEW